jgi:hypothetical protein
LFRGLVGSEMCIRDSFRAWSFFFCEELGITSAIGD